MTETVKLELINELIGNWYEGCYEGSTAGDVLIDNIYTIINFEEQND